MLTYTCTAPTAIQIAHRRGAIKTALRRGESPPVGWRTADVARKCAALRKAGKKHEQQRCACLLNSECKTCFEDTGSKLKTYPLIGRALGVGPGGAGPDPARILKLCLVFLGSYRWAWHESRQGLSLSNDGLWLKLHIEPHTVGSVEPRFRKSPCEKRSQQLLFFRREQNLFALWVQ